MKPPQVSVETHKPEELNWVSSSDSTPIASPSSGRLITEGLRTPSNDAMMTNVDPTNDSDYRVVVQELVDHTSMPYLELAAISPVDKQKLAEIVEDLERRHLVSVRARNTLTDAIVTVRATSYDQLARLIVA